MYKNATSRLCLSIKLHRELLKAKYLPWRSSLRSAAAIDKLKVKQPSTAPLFRQVFSLRRLREDHHDYATGSVRIFHITSAADDQ